MHQALPALVSDVQELHHCHEDWLFNGGEPVTSTSSSLLYIWVGPKEQVLRGTRCVGREVARQLFMRGCLCEGAIEFMRRCVGREVARQLFMRGTRFVGREVACQLYTL